MVEVVMVGLAARAGGVNFYLRVLDYGVFLWQRHVSAEAAGFCVILRAQVSATAFFCAAAGFHVAVTAVLRRWVLNQEGEAIECVAKDRHSFSPGW
jgi:hypothetical protein